MADRPEQSVIVKPNFLIAGAARSGTTALARTLAQHREVFVTNPKEVHFFCHVDNPFTYTGPGDDVTVNRHLVADSDRYYQLFASAETHRARGEGSVSTLYHPDRTIPAIGRYAEPDVKVIAIVREPAARAYSSYLYLRGRGFEQCETFEEALILENERVAAGYQHMWHLRGMSRYRDQIPAFAEAFGDRFKLLIHEEYRQDPAPHLADLCRFLEISPDMTFRPRTEINRGGQPRSLLATKIINVLRASPAARAVVRAVTPMAMRERVRNVNLDQPEADGATLQRLQAEFAADVECVESVLGRTVSSWRSP